MITSYLHTLPSSSSNNARAIVSSKHERFTKFPSEKSAKEVERITGEELQADFKDTDLGNDPKEGHEPHYELRDSITYDEE